MEELWQKVGESYLPDAIREFAKYPTVSLGWIMYVGMALAKYWDEDWELYSKVENHYEYLRDRIDFDHMDDYICEKVLLLNEEAHKAVQNEVSKMCFALLQQADSSESAAWKRGSLPWFRCRPSPDVPHGNSRRAKNAGYHMTKM